MNMQTKRIAAVGIIVVVLTLFFVQQPQSVQPEGIIVQTNSAENTEDSFSAPETNLSEIYVHVAGAVQNPGVYLLYEGQRVEDAIQKAVLDAEADADALNRAALLADGQKIVVPYTAASGETEQKSNGMISNPDAMAQGKINLNQASITELMTLPGIGEVKAAAIIQYRNDHGCFRTVEELLMVKGIGDGIYGQIAQQICV